MGVHWMNNRSELKIPSMHSFIHSFVDSEWNRAMSLPYPDTRRDMWIQQIYLNRKKEKNSVNMLKLSKATVRGLMYFSWKWLNYLNEFNGKLLFCFIGFSFFLTERTHILCMQKQNINLKIEIEFLTPVPFIYKSCKTNLAHCLWFVANPSRTNCTCLIIALTTTRAPCMLYFWFNKF